MKLTNEEFSEITKFVTLLLKYCDEDKEFYNRFKNEIDVISGIVINHLKGSK